MDKTVLSSFIAYCNKNFYDIDYSRKPPQFNSLSICVIDCVYSLRAKYNSTTIRVVKKYADKYMNGDMNYAGDTLSNLMKNIDAAGGCEDFASKVLENRQKCSGGRLKTEVCYEIARKLRLLHIDSLEEFKNFESPELIDIVLRSEKGFKDAGVNYLFMLAGDPNRCKPDIHIHQCIKDACGYNVSNEECQELFREAVAEMNNMYPDLTVRDLDYIVWNKYQGGRW